MSGLHLHAPLRGARVIVRAFQASDLTDEYVGWLNDPETVRFSNQRFRRHSIASCRRYFESFGGTDNLFLSVRAAADDTAVGTMTVYYQRPHGTADVGILIGRRDARGTGIGQDAWSTVIDWLASHPAIRKITAGTVAPNIGMVRLMERSGMHQEAARASQEIVDGVAVDVLYYARFAASRPALL
jgi:RimJ/RimL family protein N-acetyltransferase